MSTVTVSSLIADAKAIGVEISTIMDAVSAAEAKTDSYSGAQKKAMVIAVAADALGDKMTDAGEAVSKLVDDLVSFLNAFSWATKVVSVLASVTTALSFIPSFSGFAADTVSKGAELFFEWKTGYDLDPETGSYTDADGNTVSVSSASS